MHKVAISLTFTPKHPKLRFKIKHAKYSNFRITKTIAEIPTKFRTVLKTTKYSLWVIS